MSARHHDPGPLDAATWCVYAYHQREGGGVVVLGVWGPFINASQADRWALFAGQQSAGRGRKVLFVSVMMLGVLSTSLDEFLAGALS